MIYNIVAAAACHVVIKPWGALPQAVDLMLGCRNVARLMFVSACRLLQIGCPAESEAGLHLEMPKGVVSAVASTNLYQRVCYCLF